MTEQLLTQETNAAAAPCSPLYALVMGRRFNDLPPTVRAMHAVSGEARAAGRATVARGSGPLARLVAALSGFPPAGRDVPLRVDFSASDGVETWTRDFDGRRFQSRLGFEDGLLVETFSPFRFYFELESLPRGLAMRLRRWRLGPVALPLFLAPRIDAREWEGRGRFQFDVTIALPIIGLVIHYEGWLAPD